MEMSNESLGCRDVGGRSDQLYTLQSLHDFGLAGDMEHS